MSTSIDGVDPTIVNITTEVTDIVVFSATGPEGPQGPAGPEGPAFQGNAIALINPVTGLALQPGETFPVSGTLEVDLPPITIPPIELPPIEFPDQLNANVMNWPASQTINGTITVANPVSTVAVSSLPSVNLTAGQTFDVNVISGGSTFDGQLTQGGDEVSDTNPIPMTVIGTVTTDIEFPAVQEVSGTVTVANPVTSVSVSNHPSSIEVSNLPEVQEVSGTITVANPTTSVSVSNHPTSIAVSNLPVTQPVSGTVTVANPTTSVSVSNHPTSIEVSNLPASQTVNGTVTVANPTTSVTVSNLPTTQAVSGSLSITNFPVTQPVSGTVALDGPITFAPNASIGAKLMLDNGSPGGVAVSNANGVPMKPAEAAVFPVRSLPGDFVSVSVLNNTLSVNIENQPQVNLVGIPAVVARGGNQAEIFTVAIASGATGTQLPFRTTVAEISFINTHTATIEYQRNGAGAWFEVPAGYPWVISALQNSWDISFRQKGGGSGPVTIAYEVLF